MERGVLESQPKTRIDDLHVSFKSNQKTMTRSFPWGFSQVNTFIASVRQGRMEVGLEKIDFLQTRYIWLKTNYFFEDSGNSCLFP